MTQDATAVLEQIKVQADACTDDLRMVRTMEPGQIVRQGDVYVTCIEKPEKLGEVWGSPQVAEGQTKGSRHIMEGDFKLYAPNGPGPLTGPTLEVKARATLTHPEHCDVSLPSGFYAITYQRDFAAEELARVRD